MPLFKKSLAEKFVPKTVKFSKLYRSATQGGKLGGNILTDVKSSLRKSGYTDSQISKIITADQAVPVKQMKEIAGLLHKEKIFGFENDPDRAVKKFLNQERVKAQSIAHIRKEHILEAAEENLATMGTTSLNQRAIGPNSVKPGQASVLSRRHGVTAAYSISDQANASKTGSLLSRSGTTAIARPGVGQSGSIGLKSASKPKY